MGDKWSPLGHPGGWSYVAIENPKSRDLIEPESPIEPPQIFDPSLTRRHQKCPGPTQRCSCNAQRAEYCWTQQG
jgi:hypothetical protein